MRRMYELSLAQKVAPVMLRDLAWRILPGLELLGFSIVDLVQVLGSCAEDVGST